MKAPKSLIESLRKVPTDAIYDVVEITPEQAKLLLSCNAKNRKRDDSKKVGEMAEVMRKGWPLTFVPMIFSWRYLLDGQTRLKACVLANKPIQVLVVVGVSEDIFPYLDLGGRNATDIVTILFPKRTNARKFAALVTLDWKYRKGALSNRNVNPTKPEFSSHAEKHGNRLNQAFDVGLTLNGTVPATHVAHILDKASNKKKVVSFFTKVKKGGYKGPSNDFRNLWTDLKLSGKMPQNNVNEMLANAILAFNAEVKKGVSGKVKKWWTPQEPFPAIEG